MADVAASVLAKLKNKASESVHVEKDDGIISEENVSYTLTVSQADGANMNFHFVDNEDGDNAGTYVVPYNEETHTASYYTDDGDGGYVMFELKNGKIYANYKEHIEWNWGDGVVDTDDITASGAKED